MSLPLVNYSCSSSSESDIEEIYNKPSNVKRLRFENFEITKTENVDEESLRNQHDGRIRSFDHERGNWATFLYIPVNFELLEDIQESIKNVFKKKISLMSSTNIHISMTKTVILRHHWIDSFVISLRITLTDVNKFKINFGNVHIYCNEEKTRTFIGLTVNTLFIKNLKTIIEKLDIVLEEYKLDPFYSNPSFHISILWCVGDYKDFFSKHLPKIQSLVNVFLLREPEEFELHVTKLLCKIGCKSFCFDLQ